MKYIGLDLHKRKIFATVLDGDGTILARNTIGAGRQDICQYLNNIKLKDILSFISSIKARYWQRIS